MAIRHNEENRYDMSKLCRVYFFIVGVLICIRLRLKNYNVSGIFSYRFMIHGTLFKLDQSSKFPYLVVYKKPK